jgi:iron uptake system component EfeO
MKRFKHSNFKLAVLSMSVCVLAGAIASCTSDSTQSSSSTTPAETLPKVALTVTDKGCEPSEIKATTGKTIFVITNKSSQALEWEILDGVKVLEERENIAPGFVMEVKADLEAGEYGMGCGLRSNPKGKLIVQAGADSAQAKTISPSELVGPIAEYKVYIIGEVDQLTAKTKIFTDAVIAGDLATAQKLYPSTRVHWERAEPIAELFSDLDGSMDARADDFEKKEADPKFTGFHRLEKIMFQDKTTEGTKAIAEKLMSDTLDLQKRIKKLTIEPKDMVGGSHALIEEVAATKISGEENRYSGTDLWDFKANIEGSEKIVELLRPLVEKANPELLKRVDGHFAKVNQGLDKYKTADGGFQNYSKLTEADRNALKSTITALAEDLSKLRGTLGVD